jgi:L-fuconolactonase
MAVLDAQLHARSEEAVADHLSMLDAASVTGALLVQTVPQGYDNGLLLRAAADHPDRLGVVGVLDAHAPDVEEQVRRWRAEPVAVGLRIVALSEERERMLRDGTYDRLLAEAEASRVPVFVYAPRLVEEVEGIARRFAELPIVLDHLGLPQPPVLGEGEHPFWDLNLVLGLAQHENVAVKCTALPLVAAEPFPYRDLWSRIHAVLDAFGVERAMWGSDQTRECIEYDYAQAIDYVRESDELGEDEKRALLGESLSAWCQWNPSNITTPGVLAGGKEA